MVTMRYSKVSSHVQQKFILLSHQKTAKPFIKKHFSHIDTLIKSEKVHENTVSYQYTEMQRRLI